MKKIVFCLLSLCAMALTSCLPDTPGYSYTSTFARVVTIDHTVEPPRFYADYTNEQFEFSNIQKNSDLGEYKLTDVSRALIDDDREFPGCHRDGLACRLLAHLQVLLWLHRHHQALLLRLLGSGWPFRHPHDLWRIETHAAVGAVVGGNLCGLCRQCDGTEKTDE